MRKAAYVLYILQVLAIAGAIVSGNEFIDLGSAAGLGKTIGFFLPAIIGAILEYVAVRKQEKAAASAPKEAQKSSPAKAASPNQSTPSSVVYDADSRLYATPGANAANTANDGKRFCPYCGAKLIAEGNFCTSCGKKLD